MNADEELEIACFIDDECLCANEFYKKYKRALELLEKIRNAYLDQKEYNKILKKQLERWEK